MKLHHIFLGIALVVFLSVLSARNDREQEADTTPAPTIEAIVEQPETTESPKATVKQSVSKEMILLASPQHGEVAENITPEQTPEPTPEPEMNYSDYLDWPESYEELEWMLESAYEAGWEAAIEEYGIEP